MAYVCDKSVRRDTVFLEDLVSSDMLKNESVRVLILNIGFEV